MNADEYQSVAIREGKVAAGIFRLREQAELYLMANDTQAANKILILISFLEGERAKRGSRP